MKKVCVEMYCRECEHQWHEDELNERCYECPECKSHNVFRSHYLICNCGTTVYLNGFTNECYECGSLYNSFGQRLADPSEWDEEDRYDCFGPQN